MQKLFSNPLKFLGVLTGLALLMRAFSFLPSVMDHDESTYIVIADAIRHGKVYMRDVVDTKPIGIFTLFALFQTLFGKSIFVIRMITAIWVALTAWMIYLVHRQLLNESTTGFYNPAPVASGIIYICMTSVFTYFGVSPNTELFFNLFTIIALWLIVRSQGIGWYFLAGLVLGLGCMIKYVVLFDALAFGLFFIWRQVSAGKQWSYWLIRCFLMGIAFLIPLMIVWLYYRQLGMEDTFMFFTFELSGRYFLNPPWHAYIIYLLDSFLRFLPVTIWFFFCLWHWRTTGPALPGLGLLWGALVLFIILLPGKLFGHYFIQFMLPMSLVAGSFFDVRRSLNRAVAWIRIPSIGYPLLMLFILVNVAFQKYDYFGSRDYPREVAAYLNARLQPGDILYTGNYHQITYLLTNTQSPTPYIHRSLIWTVENSHALNFNQADELEKILNQNPRFILIGKPIPADNILSLALQSSYQVVKTIEKEVTVYERL